MENICL